MHIIQAIFLLAFVSAEVESVVEAVKVFHVISPGWNPSAKMAHGEQKCTNFEDPNPPRCYWHSSGNIHELNTEKLSPGFIKPNDLTVAAYNIHYWHGSSGFMKPSEQLLISNYTLAESLESTGNHGKLFDAAFSLYDAYSTTLPTSNIPRVYPDALENPVRLKPTPWVDAVKGAVFIQTHCPARTVNVRTKTIEQLMQVRKTPIV